MLSLPEGKMGKVWELSKKCNGLPEIEGREWGGVRQQSISTFYFVCVRVKFRFKIVCKQFEIKAMLSGFKLISHTSDQ